MLWSALNLGQLLKPKNKPTDLKERVLYDHVKKIKKPHYNAVIGRYKLAPNDPKIVKRQTLNRLSNPCKFRKPEKKVVPKPSDEEDDDDDDDESYYVRTARRLDKLKLERRDQSWVGGDLPKDSNVTPPKVVRRAGSIKNLERSIGGLSHSNSCHRQDSINSQSETGGLGDSPDAVAIKAEKLGVLRRGDEDAKALADALANLQAGGSVASLPAEPKLKQGPRSIAGNTVAGGGGAQSAVVNVMGNQGEGSPLITVNHNMDGSISVTIDREQLEGVELGGAPIVIELDGGQRNHKAPADMDQRGRVQEQSDLGGPRPLRRTPFDRKSLPAKRRERGVPVHRSRFVERGRSSRRAGNDSRSRSGSQGSNSRSRSESGSRPQGGANSRQLIPSPIKKPAVKYDDRGHIIRSCIRIHPIAEEDCSEDDASTGTATSGNSRGSYSGATLQPHKSFKSSPSSLTAVSSAAHHPAPPRQCSSGSLLVKGRRSGSKSLLPSVRDVRKVVDVRSGAGIPDSKKSGKRF